MKTRKLQVKAMLVACVIIFESVFAGVMPVKAQEVSGNEITAGTESKPATKYSGREENIFWSIDEEGLLTISGNGDYSDSPGWQKYRKEIKFATVTATGMTSTKEMFCGCKNLESLDLSGLDTSNVTDMSDMFGWCQSLESLDLSGLDTSNVTTMSCMFYECKGLTSLNLSNFDTSKVENMENMFTSCSSLTDLNLSGWDTGNVVTMFQMFIRCSSLEELDVSSLDTGNVVLMNGMFKECLSLKELDLSGFDTGKVEDMSGMFFECSSLKSIDISNFDTSNVKNMPTMFRDCSSLTELKVDGLDTSNVSDMTATFMGCESLASLDLSTWNLDSLIHVSSIFDKTQNLKLLTLPNLPVDIKFSKTYHDENDVPTDTAKANVGKMTYQLKQFYEDTYCKKNAHVYGTVIFTWAEDYSSAKVYLACTDPNCFYDSLDRYLNLDAIVTKEVINPTPQKEGAIVYTATVNYKEKTYKDIKRVVIDKLSEESKSEESKPEKAEMQQMPVKSVGTKVNVSGVVYRVTKAGKNPEMAYAGPKNRKVKSVTIPAAVKIDGVSYKVTSIATGALKNCKKLTKVTIGKNIIKIGKNSFYGCKKLKSIVIKSKKLKSIGKNAFKGIHKKAEIDVPSSKKKAYKKLLKAKNGYKKTMKVK